MAEPVLVPEEPRTNVVANVLSIIGFVILIIIIIWGLVHLVGLSQGWFSSVFTSPAAKIELTAPTDAISGQPFTISWKYTPSEKGTYTFLYQCQKGLQMQLQSDNGAQSGVPCGAAFSIGTTSTSVSITPRLAGSAAVKVPLSIVFIPATRGNPNVEGSAPITIHPSTGGAPTPAGQSPLGGAQPVVTTPTPTKPKPTTKPTPSTYTYTTKPTTTTGPADLAVRIIAVGMIDPATGAFVNRLPSSPYDMAAVQFDIANMGGSSTGTWYFNVQLPTGQPYTYVSPPQSSLHPGDHIVNTLRFTQMMPGGGQFNVFVDPNNAVREVTKANNSASQWIGIGRYQQPQYQYTY